MSAPNAKSALWWCGHFRLLREACRMILRFGWGRAGPELRWCAPSGQLSTRTQPGAPRCGRSSTSLTWWETRGTAGATSSKEAPPFPVFVCGYSAAAVLVAVYGSCSWLGPQFPMATRVPTFLWCAVSHVLPIGCVRNRFGVEGLAIDANQCLRVFCTIVTPKACKHLVIGIMRCAQAAHICTALN